MRTYVKTQGLDARYHGLLQAHVMTELTHTEDFRGRPFKLYDDEWRRAQVLRIQRTLARLQ